MKIIYCDLETFSWLDLKAHGTHRYAEEAEILLFTYAIDDGPVECWDVYSGEVMPPDLREAMMDQNALTVWHNGGMFDATIMEAVDLAPRVPRSRMFDTMACAMAHALPGGLGLLCDILGVDDESAKHKTGKKLIQLFCKPQPFKHSVPKELPAKVRKQLIADARAAWPGRATPQTHPKEWAEFIEYAKADITSMREVYRRLPKWNYNPLAEEGTAARFEYDLWLLDQTINARGAYIDKDLAQAAVRAADKAKQGFSEEMQLRTDGEVATANQRDALLEHIFAEYGVFLPNLTAETVERRLADPDLPDELRELLKIRARASLSSTSKYTRLINCTSTDGYLRGLLQFAGAKRTARWAGRMFQPQNLPRPTMKAKAVEDAIEAIKMDAADLVYDNVMQVLSDAIRGCIIAPPGGKLVVCDFSNIEGRFAAWLAGEDWKVKYFYDFDAGLIEFDNYEMAYSKSFNVEPSTVTKDKRQVGKVQELMLQYEGGVGAFVTGAATYRIDLDDLARRALPQIPEAVLNEAIKYRAYRVKEKQGTLGLSQDAFYACDSLKRLWRESHPAIGSYWGELKEAFVEAVCNPGVMIHARRLKFIRQKAWLRMILPSGRSVCYPSPRIEPDGRLSYMGENQYTRKWERLYTYGGKLFENATQAVARDVMAFAMFSAENDGYPVVLTVHDELITTPPDDEKHTLDGLREAMERTPPWAMDAPIASAGFEGYRYRKDD